MDRHKHSTQVERLEGMFYDLAKPFKELDDEVERELLTLAMALARQIVAGVYQTLDRAKLGNYGDLDPQILANAAIADPIQNSLTVSGGVVFGF